MKTNLLRMLPGILVGLLAPVIVYEVLRGPLHSDLLALVAGGAVPVVWTLGGMACTRRLDPFGLIGVAGFALSLLVVWLSGGNPIMLELRDAVPTGLIGAAFVISALAGRSLLLYLIRLMARNNPSMAAVLARRDAGPVAARRVNVITMLIGALLLVHGVALATLALSVPVSTYVVMSRPIGWAVLGLGALVIVGYRQWARRSQPAAIAS